LIDNDRCFVTVQVSIELFRAYVFDAKSKSFLLPMLSSDWRSLASRDHVISNDPFSLVHRRSHVTGRDGLPLAGGGGHVQVSWCLWNSHTLLSLSNRAMSSSTTTTTTTTTSSNSLGSRGGQRSNEVVNHSTLDYIGSYMNCSTYDSVVDSVFAGTEPTNANADDNVMNNHEVGPGHYASSHVLGLWHTTQVLCPRHGTRLPASGRGSV